MSLLHDLISVFSSGLEFGLLNSLMVVGLAIAFRFGNFPDLTIEGTVIMGAAVSGIALVAGLPPFLAILIAVAVCGAAGITTAVLHLATGMSRLLAGIVMMTALYALSLRVMRGSNLPLFDYPTLYAHSFGWVTRCLVSGSIVVPCLIVVVLLLHTEFGLLLRANGENEPLVRKLGKPTWVYLLVTLAISNGLVGASGAMVSQLNRFADVGFGAGTIVTGLAALLIGEAVLVPTSVGRQVCAAVLGSVVYYTIFALALRLGLHPWDLKLASAIFVLAAIVVARCFSSDRANRRIGCDPL
jgi:putative ABC transport system permease protein